MSKKEEIIKVTAELLQIQGYHATGLNEIIAKSGSPKGSLYHYFKNGKDEIVIAALLFSGEQVRLLLQSAAENTANMQDFVSAVVDYFIKNLKDSKYTKGCPVATTALETSGSNPELDKTIQAIYDSWKQVLLVKMDKKIKNREAAAETLVSLLEGALLSAKIQKNTKPLEYVKAAAVQIL